MGGNFTAPPNPIFCPSCGARLSGKLLDTEDRPRLVCDRCGHIAYLNPKLIASAIPERSGRILLLRRAIEPRDGAWDLPRRLRRDRRDAGGGGRAREDGGDQRRSPAGWPRRRLLHGRGPRAPASSPSSSVAMPSRESPGRAARRWSSPGLSRPKSPGTSSRTRPPTGR